LGIVVSLEPLLDCWITVIHLSSVKQPQVPVTLSAAGRTPGIHMGNPPTQTPPLIHGHP
jgi:hypothetical protein